MANTISFDNDTADIQCPNCSRALPTQALFCFGCGDRLSGLTVENGSSSAEAGDDLTGVRILEYTLDKKVGEGGMGAVYIGHHHALGQRVAVKVLHPDLALHPEIVERFIQEARIQSRLQHPNIVSVLTASTTGPYIAMVMDYVEGISLEQVLERRGSLPIEEVMDLFGQVIDVVGYAHTQGVVHRDIKPSNIMITADGRALVMDFGIAKVASAVRKTRTGTAMGSALYMSPEQILGRKDVDHRTDVYALGITLFELLTGRVPFGGEEDESTTSDFLVRQAHIQREVPNPRELREDIPQAVSDAIQKALAKAPEDRHQTCAAFGTALSTIPAPSDVITNLPLDRSDENTGALDAMPQSQFKTWSTESGEPLPVPIWRRPIALLLDAAILTATVFVVTLGLSELFNMNGDSAVTLMLAAFLVFSVVYFAEFVRRSGATPGKKMMNLRVVNVDGTPLSGSRSWLRSVIQILPGLVLGGVWIVDSLWAFFNPSRRCIHDFAADCIVTYAPDTQSDTDRPLGDPS